MKWEAIIFDWAGTTVDYGCFAPVQTFIEAFKAYGIEPTVTETRTPMGMLKWDHIKTMLKMDRIGPYGASLSLYDFPQHGSLKDFLCGRGYEGGRYGF